MIKDERKVNISGYSTVYDAVSYISAMVSDAVLNKKFPNAANFCWGLIFSKYKMHILSYGLPSISGLGVFAGAISGASSSFSLRPQFLHFC